MAGEDIAWPGARSPVAFARDPCLDDKLGLWLRVAQRAFAEEVNRDFHRDRVTQLDFFILSIIASNPDCAQTMVALNLQIKSPNLATAIDYLVQRRLLDKTANPIDRRANRLRLTELGAAFLKELSNRYMQITARYFPEPHGGRQRSAAVQLLKHLAGLPGGPLEPRPAGAGEHVAVAEGNNCQTDGQDDAPELPGSFKDSDALIVS